MEPSEWHSIRPWTRRLSLSIREITSVSATFILSSPLTKAESELPLVSLSVPADDGLDEDDESSDQNIQAVISDALAKGLSVNVNGSPWPRVLIRLDDKQDEAVIIIYGLMPGRQYDIDLGLVHDGNIRRHVITERELPTNSGHILMSYRSATGSTSPHSETDLDVDIAGSNSHSPTTPSNHALSTTPPITTTPSDTNGATITVEDRLKQLQQNLSLLNSDRDSLTATLKSARRDAQKADAALRTEIDILKRASDKHSAAEHRARQKVLALQEAVKRAQSATKEMEALVNEAEAALPVLIAGRGEREHAYDIVRGEADRAKEEMDREAESDMKRIEGLKGELTGLSSKLERLNGKKDKLEGGVIPVLGRQLGDSVRAGDLQPPRQLGRAAEQLLVEVVADPADRLGAQQPWGDDVHEQSQLRPRESLVGDVQAGRGAGGDPAPDPEPALPDRERTPPVIGDLTRGRDQEIDPPADQAGGKAPHRDLVTEIRVAAHPLPAPAGDHDRRDHGEHVGDSIRVEEERADAESVRGRARDERQGHHGPSNRGTTRSLMVASTASRLNGARSCAARDA